MSGEFVDRMTESEPETPTHHPDHPARAGDRTHYWKKAKIPPHR